MDRALRPKYKWTIGELTERFEKITEAIQRETHKKNYLVVRKKKNKEKLKYKDKKILSWEIVKTSEKIERMNKTKEELREKIEAMTEDFVVLRFPDEERQPYNECIGYCYGKCMYIDTVGNLLYREATDEDADLIGDTYADVSKLTSAEELPSSELEMIISYIEESPQTPAWALRNFITEETEEKENE